MKNFAIILSLLSAVTVLAEPPITTQTVPPESQSESTALVGEPTEIPIKVQPRTDSNQAQASETEAAENEVFPKEKDSVTDHENISPDTQKAPPLPPNSAGLRDSIMNILPWCLAVLMAGLAGAAGSYIAILKKQERNFSTLRESVINGSKPVHLLPEEAIRLISEFRDHVTQGANYFNEIVEKHRQDVGRIVQMAEESSRASRDETLRTVDTFKGSLNEMLGKIGKFMERVVQDTKETHNQALETKEFAKQVSALIQEKEVEISKLKQGYHLHLIGPLTKEFLKIRDDVHLMAKHSGDPQISQQLSDLDQKIGNALSDLQIEEISIQLGEKPHEIHHPRLWESLGAAEPTDDPLRHGAIARIQERGYQLKINNAEPHIIRKAVVVIHSCSTANGQSEREPISANQEAKSADFKNTTNL
jgi:hypothetical protein